MLGEVRAVGSWDKSVSELHRLTNHEVQSGNLPQPIGC
jgi:hypothetical protein